MPFSPEFVYVDFGRAAVSLFVLYLLLWFVVGVLPWSVSLGLIPCCL
jgi:hypothetical protein